MTDRGSAIWTAESTCRARSRAASFAMPRTVKTSETCLPILIEGFSAVPGFW
jgi:hypothetical protein